MRKSLKKKFGFAFWDSLEIGKKRKNLPGAGELEKAATWQVGGQGKKELVAWKISPWRLVPVYFIFFAFLMILLARAFDLQVIQGKIFLEEATGNHVRIEVDHAPRGVIYDRRGAILAQNKPGFHLILDPASIPKGQEEAVISKLASVIGVGKKEIKQKLDAAEGAQVTIVNDLSAEKAYIVEAEEAKLPGVVLEVASVRVYPHKEIMAHILGYATEADERDLVKKQETPYALGDKVGKAGVEETFEETLRGTNGYRLIKVSALGEKKGEIYANSSRPGESVTLSLDLDLQKFVHQVLSKKMKQVGAKGASAVVLDPSTGEILALVSLPSYNNNIFSTRLSKGEYNKLISNPHKLLINRAIGAAYPPGSTFKMITAAAALETGAINPETKIEDPGFIILGNQTFKNWFWVDHHKTEGFINVVRAIARSTDTFFYRVGQMIGEQTIEKYARILGLGEITDVQLPGETAGLIPNEEWKLETRGEPWYPGETLNISIGQGDLLVSSLQLSVVTAVFANNGNLITPTILKTDRPKIVKKNFLKKETIKAIREGLYQDTVGDGNVGWLFGSFQPKSAGKTGTAEAGEAGPHAWYTAYAPHPEAKIVATVMIEHAGHGSEESAPVVKQIFDWYFSNR